MKTHLTALFLTALLGSIVLTSAPALAYIGPGLGVVAIWSLLGPIAGVISLVLLIAYFPARYYYKKHKHNKAAKEGGEASAETVEAKAEDTETK